ncbi:MAG: hypothetical protein WCX46_02360 [Candidatus Paceibacterota bacterium]
MLNYIIIGIIFFLAGLLIGTFQGYDSGHMDGYDSGYEDGGNGMDEYGDPFEDDKI